MHFPAKYLALASLGFALGLPLNVYADPPSWAPAHGWRKKNDPSYVGYTGKKWDNDYGVVSAGKCNRQAVGAVMGAVAGGAIGSQVGGGDGRKIAILVGAVAGAAIGAKIGRDLDAADRACLGHGLELAQNGRTVAWEGARPGVTYTLTPVRGYKKDRAACRDFNLTTTVNKRSETSAGSACQTAAGTWQLAE